MSNKGVPTTIQSSSATRVGGVDATSLGRSPRQIIQIGGDYRGQSGFPTAEQYTR